MFGSCDGLYSTSRMSTSGSFPLMLSALALRLTLILLGPACVCPSNYRYPLNPLSQQQMRFRPLIKFKALEKIGRETLWEKV